MGDKSTRWRWLALVGCVLLAAALSVGLGATSAGAQDQTASPAAGKIVLKIGWMGEPDNMNPFIGWTNNVYEIYGNEYLKLVNLDWDTDKPAADGVAKSWEYSEDGLEVTFHLNEGITWHDGQPLTAEDVAFTYNYIIDNQISSYIAMVKGIEHVEVVDDYTAKFILSHPKANLLYLWLPIVPKHIWKDIPPRDAENNFPNNAPVIGSGPLQTVQWKKGRDLTMKTYDDFWKGRQTVDEVIYVLYTNTDTMVQDLISGTLDAAYLFPQAQFKTLENTPGIEAIAYPYYNWDYIGFNCYKGPSDGHPVLLDKNFRATLEYAIDRDQIIKIAYAGYAWAGWTFMPPKTWTDPDYHWEPTGAERRDFDPEKAKQMLDEAGYTDSDGNGIREYKGKDIKLTLWADTETPEAQKTGKLVTGWWRDLGLDVKLQVLDQGQYFDRIWAYDGNTFKPDFDAFIWEWDGYTDPGQTLDCFTTAQIEGWNEFAWSNAEYDRLDKLQNREMDLNKRAEYIKGMQKAMYDDAACIVTVHPLKLQAYRTDKWDGWSRSMNGNGPAFLTAGNPYAYFNLKPKAATEEGGSNTWWIAIVVVAGIAAVVVTLLLVRRRRPQAVEE